MPKNTDPPGYHSREITHHIVGQFKDHFSGTTDAGFRCHCGHKGGFQFTDYQAMTSPVAWELPSVVCDRVIAAWRAHTKDLDGVHPNAEDQIRDFFNRQLEQPGGPTMTRYPLTAIPIDTPKPKSIAISTVVDENLRSIIGDYAKKLGIDVDPMGTAEWDVANGPDRPWYASANVATATAMREYLARLLYGDDGLVENLQADEANINEKLDEVVAELRREEAEQPISFPNEVSPPLAPNTAPLEAVEGFADKAHAKVCASTDRPTRLILRSYAADDKPRIERLLGLARQLQLPVQLAGPWSCTAFPKGEEAHPALDVVFPEVLVHPRDVLILTFPNGEHIGDNGGSNLSEIENQLLWETREQDQHFIAGLIELLGLPAEASRGDIAAAVERSGTHYEALDARVRNILGAVDGEETDEAARRFVEAQEKVHAELGKQLEKEKRETQNRVRTETARLNVAIANLKEHADAWNCRVEKGDLRDVVSKLRGEAEQVREILDAASGEETVDAAKRVMADLSEWKRGQASWKANALDQRQEYTEWRSSALTALGLPPETSINQVVETIEDQAKQVSGWRSSYTGVANQLAAERMTTAENQRKLLDILRAGTVEPSWERCISYAEDRVGGLVVELTNARAEVDKLRAYQLSRLESDAYLERVKKERDNVADQLNAIHVRMLNILGSTPGIAWPSIFTSVEKAVKERDNLGEKLDSVHRDLAKRLGLPSDTSWFDIMSAVERIGEDGQDHAEVRANNKELGVKLAAVEKERDDLKEQPETAITAERQTIAQRIDLALTGNAVITNLDMMLRAVEACREGYTREASNSVNLRRDCEMLQGLIGQIADALDAPPGDRLVVEDDGSLNTTLADRVVGYFERLYTAAGFTEPPQGGWAQLLAKFERPREN